MTQLVKGLTLGLGLGHDLGVVRSGPLWAPCWLWSLLRILSPLGHLCDAVWWASDLVQPCSYKFCRPWFYLLTSQTSEINIYHSGWPSSFASDLPSHLLLLHRSWERKQYLRRGHVQPSYFPVPLGFHLVQVSMLLLHRDSIKVKRGQLQGSLTAGPGYCSNSKGSCQIMFPIGSKLSVGLIRRVYIILLRKYYFT